MGPPRRWFESNPPHYLFYLFFFFWFGIYLKNTPSLNNKIFFNNLYNSPTVFFLKKDVLVKQKTPVNKFNNFFFYLLKNNLFIFNNFILFKIIFNQFSTFIFFAAESYKFFFFNISNYNLNVNLLNFQFATHGILNKNFIFFFFKINWLKFDINKKKFLFFIHESGINFLFFFKPINMLNFMYFFKNMAVMLGGIPDSPQKNLFFDYPLKLDNSNIWHIFFVYKFFINLICEKNFFLNTNLNKFNFFFFHLFF